MRYLIISSATALLNLDKRGPGKKRDPLGALLERELKSSRSYLDGGGRLGEALHLRGRQGRLTFHRENWWVVMIKRAARQMFHLSKFSASSLSLPNLEGSRNPSNIMMPRSQTAQVLGSCETHCSSVLSPARQTVIGDTILSERSQAHAGNC